MSEENGAGSPADERSKTHGETWLQHFFKAAGYSRDGIVAAFKLEMAFRMEVATCLILTVVALLLPVGLLFKALVISSMLLVLVVELLNSAVEWVVDYISKDHHPFAKRAKDMGSAAVLFALVNAGVMWALVIAESFGWSC